MRMEAIHKWKAALLLMPVLSAGAVGWSGRGEPTQEPSFVVVADDLWRKALDVYRRNREWSPQKISVLSEVLNRRGEPYSVTELFFVLRPDAQGRMRAELERGLKNGEDATEKMKSKVTIRSPEEGMAPTEEDGYSVSIADSPFNPEQQEAVAYRPTEETRVLFGRFCRRFDFTFHTRIVNKGVAEQLTWTGMAWLEDPSGVPVKLEFTLAPLPKRIRSLWTIYLYDTISPDRWVLRKVAITGHGGFLFIRKRFRTTTLLGDYRLLPEAPDGG